MKLKDIFNIDLSTRGGVKLYRKIMGKYNIPKQDSKQLVKEIRNSSEGGGVKEYYYKTSNPEEIIQMYSMIGGVISGVIQYKDTNKNQGDTIEYLYVDTFVKSIIAFRIPNVEIRFWGTYDGSNVSNFAIFDGDFYNRFSMFTEIVGNPISPEQFKEEYKDKIQEITKEEYESMITYKPE